MYRTFWHFRDWVQWSLGFERVIWMDFSLPEPEAEAGLDNDPSALTGLERARILGAMFRKKWSQHPTHREKFRVFVLVPGKQLVRYLRRRLADLKEALEDERDDGWPTVVWLRDGAVVCGTGFLGICLVVGKGTLKLAGICFDKTRNWGRWWFWFLWRATREEKREKVKEWRARSSSRFTRWWTETVDWCSPWLHPERRDPNWRGDGSLKKVSPEASEDPSVGGSTQDQDIVALYAGVLRGPLNKGKTVAEINRNAELEMSTTFAKLPREVSEPASLSPSPRAGAPSPFSSPLSPPPFGSSGPGSDGGPLAAGPPKTNVMAPNVLLPGGVEQDPAQGAVLDQPHSSSDEHPVTSTSSSSESHGAPAAAGGNKNGKGGGPSSAGKGGKRGGNENTPKPKSSTGVPKEAQHRTSETSVLSNENNIGGVEQADAYSIPSRGVLGVASQGRDSFMDTGTTVRSSSKRTAPASKEIQAKAKALFG